MMTTIFFSYLVPALGKYSKNGIKNTQNKRAHHSCNKKCSSVQNNKFIFESINISYMHGWSLFDNRLTINWI